MSGEAKHTPGPWSYDMNRHTHDYVIFREGAQHSDHVRKWGCIDDGGVVGSSEWIWIEEADARLIAAAPDLLEALRLALNWLDFTGLHDTTSLHDTIARATGAA